MPAFFESSPLIAYSGWKAVNVDKKVAPESKLEETGKLKLPSFGKKTRLQSSKS